MVYGLWLMVQGKRRRIPDSGSRV